MTEGVRVLTIVSQGSTGMAPGAWVVVDDARDLARLTSADASSWLARAAAAMVADGVGLGDDDREVRVLELGPVTPGEGLPLLISVLRMGGAMAPGAVMLPPGWDVATVKKG